MAWAITFCPNSLRNIICVRSTFHCALDQSPCIHMDVKTSQNERIQRTLLFPLLLIDYFRACMQAPCHHLHTAFQRPQT